MRQCGTRHARFFEGSVPPVVLNALWLVGPAGVPRPTEEKPRQECKER